MEERPKVGGGAMQTHFQGPLPGEEVGGGADQNGQEQTVWELDISGDFFFFIKKKNRRKRSKTSGVAVFNKGSYVFATGCIQILEVRIILRSTGSSSYGFNLYVHILYKITLVAHCTDWLNVMFYTEVWEKSKQQWKCSPFLNISDCTMETQKLFHIL